MYIEYSQHDSPLLSRKLSVDDKMHYMIDEFTALSRQVKRMISQSGSTTQIMFCVEMGAIWGNLANIISGKPKNLDIYHVAESTEEDDPFLKGICGDGLYQIAFANRPDLDPDILNKLPDDQALLVFFSRNSIETIWIPLSDNEKFH